MKDFQLRNETRVLFRNDPKQDLERLTAGKRVLFVYGGGSVKGNGCYDDVKSSVEASGGSYFEFGGASREFEDIKKGIKMVHANDIELVIGAGGASVMDCAKLIAFGAYREDDLWDYIAGGKSPYGLEMKSLILIPTYPSSGSENGLGAVSANSKTGEFGTAYGIAADIALLVPKYSLSLNSKMTTYTGLVTFVQLCAATLGDRNPVSYDIGISVIKNVLKAVQTLKEDPNDLDARGVILYGATLSTSSRLGLGKEENYAYELYEVEFIPEVLYGVPYRKSLTTVFPRFLEIMAKYHEQDILAFYRDILGYNATIEEYTDALLKLMEDLGMNTSFGPRITDQSISEIEIETSLTNEELEQLIGECEA